MPILKEMTIDEVRKELEGKSVSDRLATAIRSVEVVFPDEVLIIIAVKSEPDGQSLHMSTNGSEWDVVDILKEMVRGMNDEKINRARPN